MCCEGEVKMRLWEVEKKAKAFSEIKDAGKYSEKGRKGMVLMLTFIIITTLTAIVVVFLYLTSTQLKGSAGDAASRKALWLAEAGMQKATWYLRTPVASGGKGENWTTTTGETSVSLGGGTYKIDKVESYDFALKSNNATALDDPATTQANCDKAIDGDISTIWVSSGFPYSTPQSLIIHFPYALSINKARFLAETLTHPQPLWFTPGDYTWQVSTDGTTYTPVVTVSGNSSTDRTDTFPNVTANYLKFRITAATWGTDNKIYIATIEVMGRKITSTGTVSGVTRTIQQTVAVQETTQTGYGKAEIDWNET